MNMGIPDLLRVTRVLNCLTTMKRLFNAGKLHIVFQSDMGISYSSEMIALGLYISILHKQILTYGWVCR